MKKTEIPPRAGAELMPTPHHRSRVPTPLRRRRHRPVARATRGWLREFFHPAAPHTYLGADERCVIWTRQHWLVPLATAAKAAAAMPLAITLVFLAPEVWWIQTAGWLGALAHQGWLFYTVLLWRHDQIIVTDTRLVRVSGVFTTTVDAIHLRQITDTAYHRSLLGRILDYGSLRIESAGQRQSLERLDFVPAPEGIYRATLP